MADSSTARTPGCHLTNKTDPLPPKNMDDDDDDDRRRKTIPAVAVAFDHPAASPARPEMEDKKRQKMSESFSEPQVKERQSHPVL